MLFRSIHGMSMDELKLYCRRVAGAVGMLSVRVFGEDNEIADKVAIAQGEALQLTNILRDLEEDAERDRLYLPIELLEKHDIEPRSPSEVVAHESLQGVCVDLAEYASERYTQAEGLMEKLDKRKMKPAIIMLHVYKAILDKLVQCGWHDLTHRVSISKPRKLWIALKHSL